MTITRIFRKLYEPHLFPLAPILPLYTKYFGEPEDRKNQVQILQIVL